MFRCRGKTEKPRISAPLPPPISQPPNKQRANKQNPTLLRRKSTRKHARARAHTHTHTHTQNNRVGRRRPARPGPAGPRQFGNRDIEQGLYGVAEETEEDIGVPGSPNPLYDPRRNRGAANRDGRAAGGDNAGANNGDEFADALYSGADFEQSKPLGDTQVEVVSRGIPQRCVCVRDVGGGSSDLAYTDGMHRNEQVPSAPPHKPSHPLAS